MRFSRWWRGTGPRLMATVTLLLGIAPVLCLAQERFRIAGDDWYPFNSSPESDRPGFMVEIAREALGPHAIEVDYALMPWARASAELFKGGIDGLIGAARVDAPGAIFPNHPLGASVNGFVLRAENPWEYHGIESLRAVKLGALLNYTYGEDRFGTNLDQYIASKPMLPSARGAAVELLSGDAPLEQGIQLLRTGRIDVLIENPATAKAALERLGLPLEKFRFVNGITKPQELYIAISPQYPQATRVASLLSEGVERLRRQGRLAAILGKYGVQDWQN